MRAREANRRRNEEMLARLNEVYARGMKRSEKRLLKAIKFKVGRTLKERW